jgi:hypothetical protein
MEKHKVYILFMLIVVLFLMWSADPDSGAQMQSRVFTAADDIAAFEGAVFVLEGTILNKLNAQLEVVKSVPLPLSPAPAPIPPGPVPDLSGKTAPEESSAALQVPPVETAGGGRLCADGRKVYVLYEGAIFVFDHDLNFLMSGARD